MGTGYDSHKVQVRGRSGVTDCNIAFLQGSRSANSDEALIDIRKKITRVLLWDTDLNWSYFDGVQQADYNPAAGDG